MGSATAGETPKTYGYPDFESIDPDGTSWRVKRRRQVARGQLNLAMSGWHVVDERGVATELFPIT